MLVMLIWKLVLTQTSFVNVTMVTSSCMGRSKCEQIQSK